jgi:hypothetical protein
MFGFWLSSEQFNGVGMLIWTRRNALCLVFDWVRNNFSGVGMLIWTLGTRYG